MKKVFNGEKGITLVALVITVILMLILAGVAISVLVADEGVLNRSRNAVNAYEREAEYENSVIGNLTEFLGDYLNGVVERCPVDDDFQKLLNEAKMVLTFDDIWNTPDLVKNLTEEALIPTLTETDVTKSAINGIITFTDNKGGVIRTNQDTNGASYEAWLAFDNNLSTEAYVSVPSNGDPNNYYVEYEFPQKVYAFKTKFTITNGSNTSGKRTVIVQGYNDELNEWENLMDVVSQRGTINSFPETTKELNYDKSYKRYRIYINSATGSGAGAYGSGIISFQLYGINANKYNNLNRNKKIAQIMQDLNIEEITLEQMVGNKEFMTRLINNLSSETISENEILRNFN